VRVRRCPATVTRSKRAFHGSINGPGSQSTEPRPARACADRRRRPCGSRSNVPRHLASRSELRGGRFPTSSARVAGARTDGSQDGFLGREESPRDRALPCIRERWGRCRPIQVAEHAEQSGCDPNGLDIGRSQSEQEAAARVLPTVEMNPILLKPSGDRTSHVILNGKSAGTRSSRRLPPQPGRPLAARRRRTRLAARAPRPRRRRGRRRRRLR
jgi:hypothetical protein